MLARLEFKARARAGFLEQWNVEAKLTSPQHFQLVNADPDEIGYFPTLPRPDSNGRR